LANFSELRRANTWIYINIFEIENPRVAGSIPAPATIIDKGLA
jgi:hypothetical protein